MRALARGSIHQRGTAAAANAESETRSRGERASFTHFRAKKKPNRLITSSGLVDSRMVRSVLSVSPFEWLNDIVF